MHLTKWLSFASNAYLQLEQHFFWVPIFNPILFIVISSTTKFFIAIYQYMITDIRLVLFIVMLFAFNSRFFDCITFAHGVFGIAIYVFQYYF